MTEIRIGTRKSKLALKQTEIIVKLLEELNIKCHIAEISTAGDKRIDLSLSQFGGKGAFTGEIERALIEGDIDIAVHSAKDLPVILPKELCISAAAERGNPADVIVLRKGDTLRNGMSIGTGSERRKIQLSEKYIIKDIRGNIDTRIGKLKNGEYDAIVLAAAGIERMGYDKDNELELIYLDTDNFIPAPCQGIIAVESRRDSIAANIIKKINHNDTYLCFMNERAFMREMDTGCQYPMGAYAKVENESIVFRCFYRNKKYSLNFKMDKNKNIGKMAAVKIKEQL